MHWRVPLEIALVVSVWFLAYEAVVLKRKLMIICKSLVTGTPPAAIVAEQSASSGMWAAGEALEEIYLVVLIYLLWPVFFNLAGGLFKPETDTATRDSKLSGE